VRWRHPPADCRVKNRAAWLWQSTGALNFEFLLLKKFALRLFLRRGKQIL